MAGNPRALDWSGLRQRMQAHVDAFDRRELPLEGRRHAAVALVITAGAHGRGREPSFVLTS